MGSSLENTRNSLLGQIKGPFGHYSPCLGTFRRLSLLCWHLDLCKNSIRQTITLEGKLSDTTETMKSKTWKEVVPPNPQHLISTGKYWRMEILSRPQAPTGAHSAHDIASVWRHEWAISSPACPEMQPWQNGAMQMPMCFLLLCNCNERSIAAPATRSPKISWGREKLLSCWLWPCAGQIKHQRTSLVCCNSVSSATKGAF